MEELRKKIATLSAEIEMLKLKYLVCVEAVAKVREELEDVKRRIRGISDVREHVRALGAYDEVGAGGPGPP